MSSRIRDDYKIAYAVRAKLVSQTLICYKVGKVSGIYNNHNVNKQSCVSIVASFTHMRVAEAILENQLTTPRPTQLAREPLLEIDMDSQHTRQMAGRCMADRNVVDASPWASLWERY